MLFDDLLRRRGATAAAAADGKARLNIRQRAGAAIHDFADLAIGDGMTYTDVHRAVIVIRNENDCQLRT